MNISKITYNEETKEYTFYNDEAEEYAPEKKKLSCWSKPETENKLNALIAANNDNSVAKIDVGASLYMMYLARAITDDRDDKIPPLKLEVQYKDIYDKKHVAKIEIYSLFVSDDTIGFETVVKNKKWASIKYNFTKKEQYK